MSWKPMRILVGVDGSEQSIAAARTALGLASLTGGHVPLITVVRPPEGWWGLEGSPPSPEALASAVAAGQREILDRVMNALGEDAAGATTVEELGDPTTAIINACEREQADLLVIGRRGATVMERVMLGSVADRLAHHAPCPLLIVS